MAAKIRQNGRNCDENQTKQTPDNDGNANRGRPPRPHPSYLALLFQHIVHKPNHDFIFEAQDLTHTRGDPVVDERPLHL